VTKRKKIGKQTVVIRGRRGLKSDPKIHGTGRGRRTRYLFLLCFGASTFCTPLALAKQKPPATKTISGQVLDASNHGISGASVLLTDLETHRTDAIYAGADGSYNFSGLNTYDDYKVQARYQGSTSETREVSSMDPRLQIVVNLTVSPRSQKQP
jgi:hypothetical protein